MNSNKLLKYKYIFMKKNPFSQTKRIERKKAWIYNV